MLAFKSLFTKRALSGVLAVLVAAGLGAIRLHAQPGLEFDPLNPAPVGHIAVGTNYTMATVIYPDSNSTPSVGYISSSINGGQYNLKGTKSFPNNGTGNASSVTWTVVNQEASSVNWRTLGVESSPSGPIGSAYSYLGTYESP